MMCCVGVCCGHSSGRQWQCATKACPRCPDLGQTARIEACDRSVQKSPKAPSHRLNLITDSLRLQHALQPRWQRTHAPVDNRRRPRSIKRTAAAQHGRCGGGERVAVCLRRCSVPTNAHARPRECLRTLLMPHGAVCCWPSPAAVSSAPAPRVLLASSPGVPARPIQRASTVCSSSILRPRCSRM